MTDREWLTSNEAAAVLGVSPQQVRYLARQGYFDAERAGKQWRFDAAGVRAEADDRQLWVSYLQAAELTNSDHHAVWRAVQAGEIEGRDVHRSRPSLLRSSVLDWGERRSTRLLKAAGLRQAAFAQRAQRNHPPDAEHVWLRTPVVAIMLDISPSAVGAAARRGAIPCVSVGGRRWFRRDHIEQLAAARAMRRVRASGYGREFWSQNCGTADLLANNSDALQGGEAEK